ncbi:MAG: Gfo/Idh/MocA family protein [Gallintestinimicrobium sp.]
MSTFRFAIMGAGNIAHQFCDAVTLVEDCEVSAIASKDLGRAQKFAEECSVAHAYDNYEQMLIEEKPDCVYIAVTPNDHFRLTMLCLEHRVPVLCEKRCLQTVQRQKPFLKKQKKTKPL